ncbi:MAG: hypothetical protein KatS3mg131_2374 [Candidatus Tectimicrobiota bacterium]|nr:MAG: hypothetical protein KatS3mg131_2374 [Candidatus Tectomicrobia bacterium]
MPWSNAERVRELAHLLGLTVAEPEVQEVADRLDSLLQELEPLQALDLEGVTPLVLFPEEAP